MDQEARSLIELLRDETQSRSVYDRCNEVLAAWSDLDARAKINAANPVFWIGPIRWKSVKPGEMHLRHDGNEIHATEAEVEIITGERK